MLQVASIKPRPRGLRRTWLAFALLGLVDGSVALLSPGVGVLITAPLIALIAWKGPRLAAASGLLVGLGACWIATIHLAAASCAIVDLRPGAGCTAPDLTGSVAFAGAVFAGGLLGSLLVIRYGWRGTSLRFGRRPGAVVGIFVAAGAALLGLTVYFRTGFYQGTELEADALRLLVAWTLITGAVGGFVLGPAALTAITRAGRIWLAIRLAIFATILGALGTGIVFGFENSQISLALYGMNPGLLIPFALLGGVEFALLGIAFFGLLSLPITFSAALVWTGLMWRLGSPAPVVRA